jgi:hypothetical protein
MTDETERMNVLAGIKPLDISILRFHNQWKVDEEKQESIEIQVEYHDPARLDPTILLSRGKSQLLAKKLSPTQFREEIVRRVVSALWSESLGGPWSE